jgi:glycerol-3-phosphate dehydrogenase
MWTKGWRDSLWADLDRSDWDLVIIGGGITGAGILREASRLGLRCILFEAHDFASGTSSRSSKLVHGGLRYLKDAKFRLTSESVHEREHLLQEGRGLVTPLPFLMANFRGDRIPAWAFGLGLSFYDLLALKWNHAAYSPQGLRNLCPQLTSPLMLSGFRYFDALTDDARLVLRVIQEAVNAGASAMNYTRVDGFLKDSRQKVCGVIVHDLAPGGGDRTVEVRGRVVINASGAWADELRLQNGGSLRLRILRGSHLFFPRHKLPLTRAVTFLHPQDGRPVFILPWEGVTLIGTTDMDHHNRLGTDLAISHEETDYLMQAIQYAFPDLGLTHADIQSTLSGVRAVVNTGKANPSKESREFVLWMENGLLTVSGGKLTTFRVMAHKALQAVSSMLPGTADLHRRLPVLDLLPEDGRLCDLPVELRLRLLGRYAGSACDLVSAALPGEMTSVEGSLPLWAELRWAARAEAVIHLDDLLLRRVRLGILLPGGGLGQLDRVRAIVQPELGWSDERWLLEADAYQRTWQAYYAPV